MSCKLLLTAHSERDPAGGEVQPFYELWINGFREPRGLSSKTRQVGLEPTTSRLTADCSTIELLPKKGEESLTGLFG